MSEHIYLIQTRECFRADKDVYKLGRSNGIDSRMKSYPKESIIHLIVSVENSRQTETDLIKIFQEKFEKALLPSGESYGNEYFRGDLSSMKQVFLTYIMDKCSMDRIVSPTIPIEKDVNQVIKKFLKSDDIKVKLNKIKTTILKKYYITNDKNDRISLEELQHLYGDSFRDLDCHSAEDILYMLVFEKIFKTLDIDWDGDITIENIMEESDCLVRGFYQTPGGVARDFCQYLKRVNPKRILKINVSRDTIRHAMDSFYQNYKTTITLDGICYMGCTRGKCFCKYDGDNVQEITDQQIEKIEDICDNICEWYLYNDDQVPETRSSYGFKHELEKLRKCTGKYNGGDYYVGNASTIISLMLVGVKFIYNKTESGSNVFFKPLHPLIENLPTKCVSEKNDNKMVIEEVEQVKLATSKLVDSKDSVKAFWEDQEGYTYTGIKTDGTLEQNNRVKKAQLYTSYCEWIKTNDMFKNEGKITFYKKTLLKYIDLKESQKLYWVGMIETPEVVEIA